MIDEQDLIAYLRSKGLQVHRAAGAEVTVHCIFCADGDSKGKGKLYFNTESWLYSCKRCDATGNRRTLLAHFGDEDALRYVDGADPMLRRRLLAEAAELAHEMLLNNDAKLSYLLDRGIAAELIVEHKLGYVPRNVGLSEMLPSRANLQGYRELVSAGLVTVKGREFFNDCITIPYFSHGSIVQIRAKFVDGKYLTTAGDSVRLHNADALFGADEVLITEGELDDFAVRSALLQANERSFTEGLAVVGLPGAGSWPEGLIEMLSGARKVFIGLDPDDTGRKFAVKLKAQIGSRARLVELPGKEGEKVDWTDYLTRHDPLTNPHGGHNWRDVRDLLVEADLAGKQMFTVADSRAKWRKRKTEAPGLKLGWPSLDSVIRPGLKPGQIMIPLAKSGCIQGDAEVVINRAGASKRMSLADLVFKFNGGQSGNPDRVRGRGNRKVWNPVVPTRIQREVDGEVRLGTIKAAWCSGEKQTYTVTTETGRTIRATDEHPFLTERGWLRLDQLTVGEELHVRGERQSRGRASKVTYRKKTGLHAHPFAKGKSRPRGANDACYPAHRLVAEATLNGLDLASFEALVRAGRVDNLCFLNPEVFAVHHVDHDPHNNNPANLKVLTHSEHAALHASEGTTANVQIPVAIERVVSIEAWGMEQTYDIEVADDPHNFIANGFVVHNTGKSVWLSNVAMNLRNDYVLFASLELTAPEVYEHLRRIHRFWYPKADEDQVEQDLSRLRVVERNRLRVGDLEALCEQYAEDVGRKPSLVIVDYLQYYARGFPAGSMYERVSDAAMELKAVAKEQNLAIICPSQVNRGAEHGKPLSADDARDSGVVDETGDFVLSLFRPDQLVNRDDPTGAMPLQSGNFNMQLLKSRHGGKGRTSTLRFSNMSLAITDSIYDRANTTRVEQENSMFRQGMHYDDLRSQQDESIAQRMLGEVS